jgi:D-proline reductase (dithiol) PrdB
MGDQELRAIFNQLPVPEFATTPFTRPPRQADATVAIVTTAGLHLPEDRGWSRRDQSFRVLPSGRRDLQLGHSSSNYDQSGLLMDLNVVYPADRLEEMRDMGAIGTVAPRHLAFMGSQDETMTTIRLDTGPAAAKLLLDDGVDVVLLTPI